MRKVNLDSRNINYEYLKKYGFKNDNNKYIYYKNIYNDEFKVTIEIENSVVTSHVIELAFNEEYSLVDIDTANGEYVGNVRIEYEKVLNDFIDKCTYRDSFKQMQTKEMIEYIKDKYNSELEFLWDDSPNAAVFRNLNNQKWYGIIMTISKSKLGLDSDDLVEIVDLRYQKDLIDEFVDDTKIFRGFHMNKKSWISIMLDYSIKTEELFKLIDNSYSLSNSK